MTESEQILKDFKKAWGEYEWYRMGEYTGGCFWILGDDFITDEIAEEAMKYFREQED